MNKIKTILVLIGPPGSGKGTQGKLLAPILQYNYLSMGQVLREYSKQKTPEAKLIKKTIDSGHIIPDTLLRKIFFETLKSLPKADGIIFDGFPRDIGQAPLLEETIVKYDTRKLKALFIDVPKVKILERLKIREGKESRADDDPAVVETRFQEYDHKTHPLIKYFEKRSVLTHINGDQEIENVHAEILTKLTHAQIRI